MEITINTKKDYRTYVACDGGFRMMRADLLKSCYYSEANIYDVCEFIDWLEMAKTMKAGGWLYFCITDPNVRSFARHDRHSYGVCLERAFGIIRKAYTFAIHRTANQYRVYDIDIK